MGICPEYQKTGVAAMTDGSTENKVAIGWRWSAIVFDYSIGSMQEASLLRVELTCLDTG